MVAITTESTEGDEVDDTTEDYSDTWKAICDEKQEFHGLTASMKYSNNFSSSIYSEQHSVEDELIPYECIHDQEKNCNEFSLSSSKIFTAPNSSIAPFDKNPKAQGTSEDIWLKVDKISFLKCQWSYYF